jgi:5-methylcytosine-specific restriction enzyme A
MVIFKTAPSTLKEVLTHCKHASHNEIKCVPGETILIQQTLKTLKPSEKSIRWAMDYVRTYFDQEKESDEIWGSHWNFIIEGKNLRYIEPFDIEDIQISAKNYKSAVTHARLEKSDEESVLDWIDENEPIELETTDLSAEVDKNGQRDMNAYIEYLNNRYSGTPKYKAIITKQVNRPSPLRNAIIKRDGTICKICNSEGFIKRNGLRYCEVHHMIELNKLAPNTLQSWNVIIVCPTCHKQLHHGKVKTKFLNPGWSITIENRTHILR